MNRSALLREGGTLLASLLGALVWLLAPLPAGAQGLSLRGNVGVEYLRSPRFEDASGLINPVQTRENLAARLQVEAGYAPSQALSFALRAFVREDARDADRSVRRADEAWVQYAAPDWDLRLGNQIVTWGSVESVSPLDVVNPRDYEEDLVEPRKIGTFMARARWRLPSSDLSVWWLPRYEPSVFSGPRSYYSISAGLPQLYPAKRWHRGQGALRYFRSGDGYDLGLSYFDGLERNAGFQFDPERAALVGETHRTRRLGLDVTKTLGELVLKGEFVYRSTPQPGRRRALLYVVGGEWNLSSVWGHSDLTLFAEYLGTSRNVRETELMQDDLFVAARWAFNDHYRQRVQLGTFRDLNHSNAYVWRVEYQASPADKVDATLRYTLTRNYFPGPRHAETDDGVLHLLVKFNF